MDVSENDMEELDLLELTDDELRFLMCVLESRLIGGDDPDGLVTRELERVKRYQGMLRDGL